MQGLAVPTRTSKVLVEAAVMIDGEPRLLSQEYTIKHAVNAESPAIGLMALDLLRKNGGIFEPLENGCDFYPFFNFVGGVRFTVSSVILADGTSPIELR